MPSFTTSMSPLAPETLDVIESIDWIDASSVSEEMTIAVHVFHHMIPLLETGQRSFTWTLKGLCSQVSAETLIFYMCQIDDPKAFLPDLSDGIWWDILQSRVPFTEYDPEIFVSKLLRYQDRASCFEHWRDFFGQMQKVLQGLCMEFGYECRIHFDAQFTETNDRTSLEVSLNEVTLLTLPTFDYLGRKKDFAWIYAESLASSKSLSDFYYDRRSPGFMRDFAVQAKAVADWNLWSEDKWPYEVSEVPSDTGLFHPEVCSFVRAFAKVVTSKIAPLTSEKFEEFFGKDLKKPLKLFYKRTHLTQCFGLTQPSELVYPYFLKACRDHLLKSDPSLYQICFKLLWSEVLLHVNKEPDLEDIWKRRK